MKKAVHGGCLAAGLAAAACCVAASMSVRTPGGERLAGEVVVGDAVVSIDVATGELLTATVVQVRRATRECLALRWPGGALVCTPDHPLYSPETGTYRPASDWVTGSARTLLIAMEDGVRVARVESSETFAGVHEVIDLTLDVAPHNFVAAGVVVHNKSPAGFYTEGEAVGPTVRLGVGEAASFRVRACADGMDEWDLSVGMDVVAKTVEVPTEPVPFELTVSLGDAESGRSGSVPFDEAISDFSLIYDHCNEGLVVTLSRTDEGISGAISVTWTAHASISMEPGDERVEEVVVTIEPEP